MPDIVEKLIENLVSKGLVKANIRVQQRNYVFVDGKLEIQGPLTENEIMPGLQSEPVLSISRPEEPKKSEIEIKIQANEFLDDYFQPKKVDKAKNRHWRKMATMFISTVIVLAAILFISGKIGRDTFRQNESQAKQKAGLSASNQAGLNQADSNYLGLIKEATDLLAAGQLDSAWQKAEQAEKIKPTGELVNLKREIQKKQEEAAAKIKLNTENKQNEQLAAKEITRTYYLEAYEKFRRERDLVNATDNLNKAKQIRNGPDIKKRELELQAIQALIEQQKKLIQKSQVEAKAKTKAEEEKRTKAESEAKELARNNYLRLSRISLKKRDPRTAMKWLLEAKKIRNSQESIALENQIEDLYAELMNKQAESKSQASTPSAQETAPEQTSIPAAAVRPKVVAGKISSLASNLAEKFSLIIKRIEISGLPSDFSPSGFVAITINVDENGYTQVRDINDKNLRMEKEPFRQIFRQSFTDKLNALRFPEPKNGIGEPIRVENWRLNFKIGKFSGKIIMNRQ